MKNLNEENRKNKKTLTPEQIIEQCRQKFINILPNTFNRQPGSRSISTNSQNLAPINIIYRKEEIKQVIRQLSIFLQLTIQNCVLTSDPKIRTQCLRMLGNFRNYLSRDLQEFENIVSSRIKGRLPDYQVDCKPFFKKDVNIRIPPQISLYQDPLLFYIYSRIAQEQLFCNHSIMMTRQQRIEILKNHIPIFNPLFIPIISQRLQTKAKFTQLEDRLLQMIISLPRRDITKVRMIYFPTRPEQQIKNRIKNLCSNGKDVNNPIKQMKINEYNPLNNDEIQILKSAFERYGPRWSVISKYYQIRSSQFLQAEYNHCQKLSKKRQKERIECPYSNLKDLLQQKHIKHNTIQVIQIEQMPEQGQQSNILQQQQISQQSHEPIYKIINNQTFIIQQI